MATAKKAQASEGSLMVNIPPIKIDRFTIKLIGDTPLICHAWSEKATMEILNKQQKKAATAKEVRRPYFEFAESLYWLTEKPNLNGMTDEQAKEVLDAVIPHSKFGFPTTAFKAAALDAGFQQGALSKAAGSGDLAKTTARGAFHIDAEYAVIEGTPILRKDMVRIGGASKTADLRFRAEFKIWSTSLTIKYNRNVLTVEQIMNLFQLGGFSNGIGEWRPARDGNYGTYHVE